MLDSRHPRIFSGLCLGGPRAGTHASYAAEWFYSETIEDTSPVFNRKPDAHFNRTMYRFVGVTLPDRTTLGFWVVEDVDPNKAIRSALAFALTRDAMDRRCNLLGRARQAVSNLARLASGEYQAFREATEVLQLLSSEITKDHTLQ